MSAGEPVRPTVARVDLRALTANLRALRAAVGPSVGVLAVVKADAYGHGAAVVARLLEGLGVRGFAVATVEEGAALRRAGVRAPVLVLGAAFGRQHGEVVAHRLTPVLGDPADVAPFAAAARRAGVARLGIHVKVDTGMGRLGVAPRLLGDLLRRCAREPVLRVDALCTHLARAEEPDPAPTLAQLAAFRRALDEARAIGAAPLVAHAANSAAALRFPEARLDLVRPGIALYGVLPSPSVPDPGLEPVLSVHTRVNALREIPPGAGVSYGATFVARRRTLVATLPVGYADGYPRALSGRAQVLVRGRRAPLVGAVCMDLCMVDVTDVPGVRVGDRVTLLGGEGPAAITAAELAAWAGTIPYEILAGLSRRVPRAYPGLGAGEMAAAARGGGA